MSFKIITDSTANLPFEFIKNNNISIIPLSYYIDEKEHTCVDIDSFDDKEYYSLLKNSKKVTTSQINPQKYIDFFEPFLKGENDILFIGISSGISGTVQSAKTAKAYLSELYPNRNIVIIDSLGASMGEGLLCIKASECLKSKMDIVSAEEAVLNLRDRMYQVFTVNDLMFLKRGGRLSGSSAFFGTVLNIKPILKGNENGNIVACGKVRGRMASIKEMAERYKNLAIDAQNQTIAIAHADCEADANELISLINEIQKPKNIITVKYEPVTGSHVGPGALALFFEGAAGVRVK